MSKMILVVDDEPDIVAFLTTLFEDNAYATCSANDGEQAKALLEKGGIDLVTLDIVMPNKTGVRLYREMKKDPALARIPILFVSGLGDFKSFMKKIRPLPDPSDFVGKPIDKDVILKAVAGALA